MRLFSSREERLFYPDYEVEFVIEIHKMCMCWEYALRDEARMSALKDEEGGEKMAEDIFARMRREGREEGRDEVRSDFVKILLKDTSPSEISRKFNIPLSEVRAIEKSIRA